jgi:hypothetical protein
MSNSIARHRTHSFKALNADRDRRHARSSRELAPDPLMNTAPERFSLTSGETDSILSCRSGALDLILRSVRARMMGVALVIEVAGMYADDRAADAAGLGIPAHAIMDLEALRHGRPLRCRRRTAKEVVLALNAYLAERHEHSNRCAPHRFLEIVASCRQFALLNLEARA